MRSASLVEEQTVVGSFLNRAGTSAAAAAKPTPDFGVGEIEAAELIEARWIIAGRAGAIEAAGEIPNQLMAGIEKRRTAAAGFSCAARPLNGPIVRIGPKQSAEGDSLESAIGMMNRSDRFTLIGKLRRPIRAGYTFRSWTAQAHETEIGGHS